MARTNGPQRRAAVAAAPQVRSGPVPEAQPREAQQWSPAPRPRKLGVLALVSEERVEQWSPRWQQAVVRESAAPFSALVPSQAPVWRLQRPEPAVPPTGSSGTAPPRKTPGSPSPPRPAALAAKGFSGTEPLLPSLGPALRSPPLLAPETLSRGSVHNPPDA